MQIFLDGWIEQARRYEIPSELIVVEWNPPPDRPQLTTALRWPKNFGQCAVRIIEVPPELHHRYAHFEALPLYQMIAKNVGIRRARGEFVLATNIDILFSNELAEFISRQELNPSLMYRIDRHDAMSEVPVESPLDEQLEYCRTHLLRINRREGTFPTTPDGTPDLGQADIAAQETGILFGPGWFSLEWSSRTPFRWAQEYSELFLGIPARHASAVVLDIEPGPGTGGAPLNLEVSFGNKGSIGRVLIDRRSELRIPLPAKPPDRLRLRAMGCAVSAAHGPRSLCLRVFRIKHERRIGVRTPNEESMQESPTLRPVGRSRQLLSWWASLQYLIHKLATEGPLVHLTIPISPRLAKLLRIYVDSGGLTGIVRRGFRFALPTGEKVPDPPRHDLSTVHAEPTGDREDRSTFDFLHTNGCGDFTLLARERWLDLRGYPEFDVFSMNLDSVFCFAAHYGGTCEQVLTEPMRIYHIEHGTGSGWTPEGQAALFERIAAKGLSFIPYEEVIAWAAQMSRLRSPMIFNHESWGLNDFCLNEMVPPAPD